MIKSNYINQYRWLGLQHYEDLEDQQKKLVSQISKQQKIVVLGAEFYSVLTLGVRGNIQRDLVYSEQDILDRNLSIRKTDRGGQATIHSPGQLIIYPMLDLNIYRMGIQEFVLSLMSVTTKTLNELGIKSSYFAKDPGIYTDQGKLGFCGLRLDQGVVRHGLSININNDLSLFDGIRSCGQSQACLDQVSRYHAISPEHFFNLWCHHFEQDFYLSVPNSIGMSI